MATMKDCLSIPVCEGLNLDLAIRRFCPARIEHDQQSGGGVIMEDIIFSNNFELPSPCDDTPSTPRLADSEVDELIDSFFNSDDDQQRDDHDIPSSNDKKYSADFNFYPDDESLDPFSEVNSDVFEDDHVPMMIEDDPAMIVEYASIKGPEMGVPSPEEVNHGGGGVGQGLRLVHFLLACAEAVGCRDTQLADSILSRIWASVNPWGDSLQRISYCFAMGLMSRLSLLQNVNNNCAFTNGAEGKDGSFISREEKMEAFQLLHQMTPYIAFGFLTANEGICQAAQGKDNLHIIDLGMEHALQWPSLIRSLASRPEGPPRVRITGLIDKQNSSELKTCMRTIVEDARSLGLAMEFDTISDPVTPSLFTRENLNLRNGEALFVNSTMHLHKFVKESRGSLKVILQAIKKLNPTLLTIVEQDANHNGPFFLGRFLESLHYYSAIFDSLEASLPRNSPQRKKIEKHHFTETIRNIIAYEGSDRTERHERADQWRRQLGRAGFQVVGLKCISQARMMLSVYGCNGYTLASEKGFLLLGWKGRPIMLASAWEVHNASSSPRLMT